MSEKLHENNSDIDGAQNVYLHVGTANLKIHYALSLGRKSRNAPRWALRDFGPRILCIKSAS